MILFRDVVCKVVIPSLLTVALAAGCYAQNAPGGDSATMASSATSSPSTPTTSPADRVILKVGELKITQAQFEQYVADLESQQGPAELSRKKLGDNYASLLMLEQQAKAHNLESTPQVQRLLAIDRTQILSNAEFARLKDEAKPTPQQISDYYNTHADDYDVLTVRRVFVWKKSPGSSHSAGLSPEDAKAMAAAIRKAYESGADGSKLVKNPESVSMDVQPVTFQHGELPTAFEKAALSLHRPGEWTEAADSSDAIMLLQLVSRGRRSLAEVTPQIEKKLQSEKLKDELNELKKESGIWMDEGYFASKSPIATPSTGPEASGHGK